jgi:aminopeptidase N
MIEKYVGPDAFRKGVVSYLKKYSYSNAAGEDFWNEVARVTGQAGRSDHAQLRGPDRRAGADRT